MKILLFCVAWFGIQNQMITAVLRLSEEELLDRSSIYDVTHPFQVDENGNFLSHTLEKVSSRIRRDAEPNGLTGDNVHQKETDQDTLYLNITAFGTTYNIALKKKRHLLAPDSAIFRHFNQSFTQNSMFNENVFTGYVTNSTSSLVAMTTFDGLAGYFKTDGGEFFVEPLEDLIENGVQTPQRHVVYKTWNRHFIGDKTSSRSKRHARGKQYNIEVLLMADDTVVEFHGDDRVQSYLVTLMNIVDEIYQDDSIGHKINVVIVRLSFLSRQHSDRLIVENDPAASLRSVCQWARDSHHMDGGATSAITYDHAIFLTRRRFGPMGMEGYAHVTGMCHPLRSCTLNHEDGFSSAFVVAHETGHVLGMEHDGEGNKCGDETSMGSIMAPLVQAAFHRYHWSRCSQYELKGNIRKFGCLLNNPHAPDWGSTEEYPGVYYSLDDQCRFDFGPGYKQCTAFQNIDICQTLWCSHDDNPMFCKTKNGPPVDGTECAENMWCFKSHCVWRNHRRGRIDGGWGQWTKYGLCSRSCGTGVKTRTRQCNRPRPSYGGNDCPESYAEHSLCNTRSCAGSYDYRAEQCRYHQKKEYGSRRHTWLPYESDHDDLKCELFCTSKETGIILSMGSPVADGTRCSYDDPFSICINSQCVKVGCDGVIGSSKREDECGTCQGDGSLCRRINSTYRKLVRKPQNSYMKMFILPMHARRIVVREASSNTGTIIALKNRKTGRYILNQRGSLVEGNVRKQIIDAGTKWTYTKTNEREDLRSNGPLLSEYAALVVLKNHVRKVKVHYSFVMHSSDLEDSVYQYEIRKWYPCSVTCGEGTRLARYGCHNKRTKKWVRKSYCRGNPPRRIRKQCSPSCRRQRWDTSRWGSCSVSCGENGVKTRTVTCHSQEEGNTWQQVDDVVCRNISTKPSVTRTCTRTACPAEWTVGNWSLCSVSCGEGLRQRETVCSKAGQTVDEEECLGARPARSEDCSRPACEDEVCESDQSIFCKLSSMAKYCSIAGYHQLCCDSCRSQESERPAE